MPQVPEGHLATQTYLYIPGKTGQAAAEPLPWESETSENPRASPLPGYKLPGTPSWWGHTQPRNCVSHVPGQVPWDLLPHSALRLCSAPGTFKSCRCTLMLLYPSCYPAGTQLSPSHCSRLGQSLDSEGARQHPSSPGARPWEAGAAARGQQLSVWAEHPSQSPSPAQPPC